MNQNQNIPPEKEFGYVERAAEVVNEATEPVIRELGEMVVAEAEGVAQADAVLTDQAPEMVDRLIADSRNDVSGDGNTATGVADEAAQYLQMKSGHGEIGDLKDARRTNPDFAAVLNDAAITHRPTRPAQKPTYGISLSDPKEDK